MKFAFAFALIALCVCATYAQTDTAKDAAKDAAKDKVPAAPDAPKLDKDAVTTPDPKEATKKLEDAAGKAKDQAADIGKKLTEGFKL